MLLTVNSPTHDAIAAALTSPSGASPVRPNTPVLPFGATTASATFVDPSVRITYGKHIVIGHESYIAPYATLDAGPPGFIKIGNALDRPGRRGHPGQPEPAARGRRGRHRRQRLRRRRRHGAGPFPDRLLRGQPRPDDDRGQRPDRRRLGRPGAIVGALARVGPGVTIPTGYRVLPGANVTTQAQASNPALGKVVAVTASDLATVVSNLSNNVLLAAGYTTLYQGNAATGASVGVLATIAGINSGNLANVRGTSPEPGTTTVKFEPASQSPQFLNPLGQKIQAAFTDFRARIVGQVVINERPGVVAHRFGRGNSLRGDEGQPITIGSIAQTGNDVSIHSPISGTITIGQNLVAGDNARILGGPASATTLGNDVTVGPEAVVTTSNIGAGSDIGARSYVSGSTLPPGTVVPPGTILINNKNLGTIQW